MHHLIDALNRRTTTMTPDDFKIQCWQSEFDSLWRSRFVSTNNGETIWSGEGYEGGKAKCLQTAYRVAAVFGVEVEIIKDPVPQEPDAT